MVIHAMKREYVMEKLIGLTNVCLTIVSLAIMITDPAHASPVSTSPFMKADTDQVEDRSLSAVTGDHLLRNQRESTSTVPLVIDDTIPPWLPPGSELLILEVPLSEPPGSGRETDSSGVLLMYEE
jgi:hypothetical protein